MGLTAPPASFENCVAKDYCLLREQKTKEYIDLKVDKVEEKLASDITTLRDYVDDEIAGTYEHRERTVQQIYAEMKEQRKTMDEFKSTMLWTTIAGNGVILAAIIGLFVVR